VNYLKDLRIPFRGLKIGIHDYEWEIDKKFFEVYENPDVTDCQIKVDVQLDKQERMMALNFDIRGTLISTCDRCLGELKLPVRINEHYIFKLGQEREEESENIMIIPESDYQIDIGKLIFDYITLAIPIKKVHGSDGLEPTGCDPEALKILENLTRKEGTDPRWDALKNIKLDNNN
jgi:uncharacterized metal-binding protein YceD (DUF177 family)